MLNRRLVFKTSFSFIALLTATTCGLTFRVIINMFGVGSAGFFAEVHLFGNRFVAIAAGGK
jgi:hypothetical protein